MNLTTLGYTLKEELKVDGATAVYRCVRDADGAPVIIKALPPHMRNSMSEARLRYEFKIAQLVAGAAPRGVLRALELVVNDDMMAMVSADSGGYALSVCAAQTPFSLSEILAIAEDSAAALTA